MMSVSLKRVDNAAEEFCHGKVDALNDQKTQTASAFTVLDEDDPSPKGKLDIFLLQLVFRICCFSHR